uniref:Uncharacterized protein n=1 Tax=Anopheles atroparvus TaxID=41427 RepID=A0AAG5DEZ3_ANOAO
MKWKKLFNGKQADKKQRPVDEPTVPAVQKTIKKPCCSKCAIVCKCKHHRRVLRSITIPPRCLFETNTLPLN